MDTRLTSAVPHQPLAPARLDAAPVREAVRTDLPVPVAVAAQVGAEQTRFSRGQRRAEDEQTTARRESSIETDRETGDLIYRVIDPETRATVAQYPNNAILKLRAYVRSTEDPSK